MNEIKELLDDAVQFCRDHQREIRRWLLISLGLTVVLNLLWVLLPILPAVLLLALPLAGWRPWDRQSDDGQDGT